ncbi:putative ubiquitin-protein ligase Sel1/Ubx2 [Talaromyces proteolyticus]|uniref:Ubiquitin-protein ligase Sel1/Ubx2 n=1 Tax=Talaromyces proteolyticus TaxID=1131652 RepID=A0AAD4KRI7_9EURO|nr:putative ubiquitin-protein ligase Sel1/Ubx2 [Talaromyces proteolyticus]KAH8698824.1 putative ubiquitin-protein ligase Sel1/Ubx2 [Talaromyces proteolyticus]
MKSWERFIFPLVLVWLSLGIVVECWDRSSSVSTATDASEQPRQYAEGNTFTGKGGQQDVPDGRDLVESALQKLRDVKISLVAREKPSGLAGYAFYYAKHAFYLLFMNGPPLDENSDSKQRPRKLDPGLTQAVDELELAARERHNPDAMFLLAEMNFYGNFSHPRNFKEAYRWYNDLALLTGNSTAQYIVGFMHATGIGDAVDRDQGNALLYHKFAAEQGNTRSEMTLAYRHHVGIGTHRNCDQAAHYYKRVADKAISYLRSGPPGGHHISRESYRWADIQGGVYGEGASVSSSGQNANNGAQQNARANLEDLLEYLDLLSKKGMLQATLSLGKMHYDGERGLPRNYNKAMKYFKAVTKRYWSSEGAILASHPVGIEIYAATAAAHIGMMHLRGEGVKQNFNLAMTWFKRGLANGDALCQYQLGLMYLHGYGVKEDAFKASDYFKAAADQDYAAAQTRLGALFLDQGDVSTATKYFELAARWGWMEAFYYLAEIANFGIGGERHCGIASAYYKIVAEKAERVHSSFTEANDAYQNGDYDTALIATMMAAEQGYEHAQANVAYLLDEQQSVLSLNKIIPWTKKPRSPLLQNTDLALIYWTRSARQSNIDSLVKMGDYYLKGLGSSADAEKASTCYHTAAEAHRSAQAYWNLGWMHENGVAVEQDFHMAKRYYDLALANSQEAYFPVKLSLIKLRLRHFWNRITNGKVNPIQDETENKAPRSFKEWVIAFLENDEEDTQYHAQLFRDREEDELLGTHHHHDDNDDGYYDELELEIDESVLEALIIVALAATLLILVYVRQQRNRQRDNNENAGNNGGQLAGGGQNAANGQQQQQQQGNNDRGFFPQRDQPEFAQWVAGGIGH